MVDDVVVSVKTEVEKAESLVKLRENVARLGETSLEVNEGVDSLVESINAIAEAKEIAEDVASTTEAFNEQAEALTKAKEEYKRANEALLQFGDALSDIEKKEAEAALKSHEKEVARLTKSYDKAEKAMTKANDRYASASGYVKQLSTDSSFYERELGKTIVKQQELNTALDDMKELSLAKKDLGLENYQEEIDKLEQSYKALASSGKLSTEELQLAHQRLTEETKRYRKQLDGTQGAINNLKKGIPSFLAVTGIFAKMAKDAINYEAAMADVAKVMGGTDEEVNALSKSLVDLSKEVPIAADGLAKIAESGALIGLKADDLEQFTKQVAVMSTAFSMSTDKSGKAVSDMMNVFQIGLSDVNDLTDAINHLSNNGAADAEDIIESLTRVGGAAQNFGLAKEEVAALASSFIALGMTPEIASTSIKGFLTDLSTAEQQGEQYQKSLEKMGLSSVELATAIRENPQKAIIDFLSAINKLDNADVTGVLTNMFGKGNQSNIASMARAVDQLSASFGMVGDKASYAGSANTEFESKLKTTESQMQLLKNNIDALSLALGEKLLPILNKVLESGTDLVKWTNEFSDAHPHITNLVMTMVALAGVSKVVSAGFKLLTLQGKQATSVFGKEGALVKGMSKLGVEATKTSGAIKLLGKSFAVLEAANLGKTIGKDVGDQLRKDVKWVEQAQNTVTHGYMQLWTAAKGLSSASVTLFTKGPKEAGKVLEKNTQQLELQAQTYKEMQADAGKHKEFVKQQLELERQIAKEKEEQEKADQRAKEAAEELLRIQQERERSIRSVSQELERYGLSVTSIQNEISKQGDDAIRSFSKLGNEAAATSEQITAHFVRMLEEVKTPKEVELLIGELDHVMNQLNDTGDGFKINEHDADLLNSTLANLRQELNDGATANKAFEESIKATSDAFEEQRLAGQGVTSELEKQLDVINKQLKKEEELLQSKIDALKAERDLATARDESSRAAELTRQIASKELELIQAKLKASGKLTELESKELERLNAKVNAGEKLNDTEKKHLEALKHSIALRANEVAALGASAEAKAMDTQATDANTAALQRRNNAASGASKSIKKTAEAVDDVDKATKKTTSSGGGSTKFSSWLKDAGDTALLAQSQIDGLKNSVLGAQKYLVGGVQDIHGFVNANKHLRYELEQLQKGVDSFKSLRDEISSLKEPTLSQITHFESMAKSMSSIDDKALGAVKDQLKGMKDEILALRQESEQLLTTLQKDVRDEQARAMGREYRIQQTQKTLELEEKIAVAKAKGDAIAVRNLQEALEIQQRIDRISASKARNESKQKVEKRVAIDLNVGNEPHLMETDEETASRVLKAIERMKRTATPRR